MSFEYQSESLKRDKLNRFSNLPAGILTGNSAGRQSLLILLVVYRSITIAGSFILRRLLL